MAYRNGTYVAFAADGAVNIMTSDIKYYRLLTGWNLMKNRDFKLINSHEKGPSLRKGSLEETIKRTLRVRLDESSRLLLLVGNTTRFDDDFVPYEIRYAIDTCGLPVIVCYLNERNRILSTDNYEYLLPQILKDRIKSGLVKTIHIPFRQKILNQALNDFNHNLHPSYNSSVFTNNTYNKLYPNNDI